MLENRRLLGITMRLHHPKAPALTIWDVYRHLRNWILSRLILVLLSFNIEDKHSTRYNTPAIFANDI